MSAATASQPPTCRECGHVYNIRQKELPASERDYVTDAEGVLCRNKVACRGRQMHTEFNRKGLKWSRHPDSRLLALMDLPPAGWDASARAEWVSVHPIEDRVMAAVEFYSTCHPVYLWFACQTDPNGEPVKEFGEWKHHTTRSLAAVLGVDQSTVVRAVQYWVDRKLLRREEERLYIDPVPESLKRSEREACTRISESNLKDLAALSPQIRRILSELADKIPQAEYASILLAASDACTQLNADIADARTRAKMAVLDACNGHLSLLSRPPLLETPRQRRAGESPSVQQDARPPASLPRGPHINAPPNQLPAPPATSPTQAEILYNGIPALQQRYPKSPFADPPFAPPATSPTQAEILYNGIPALQQRYPKSPFADPPFNALGKADREFTQKILAAIAGYDAADFLEHIEQRFRVGRSPYDSGGPKTLGLLLEWAGDFVRSKKLEASRKPPPAQPPPPACPQCSNTGLIGGHAWVLFDELRALWKHEACVCAAGETVREFRAQEALDGQAKGAVT